jgi:hypothetical protein
MRSGLTETSIKPLTSDPKNIKGMASSTMLTKIIARELRELDSEPESRKTRAAARKSAGR